jgi:glutamine amidotransferase
MVFSGVIKFKDTLMIIIVDYNAGNLTSVKRALDHLSIPCTISPDPDLVMKAEKVIFPGVGHAGSAMQTLKERHLDEALREVFKKGTPLLGICLGTQIILSASEETDQPCLGIIDGTCPRFALSDKSLKIPHMGWDSIAVSRQHPVLEGTAAGDEFYFVHSYYPQPDNSADILATCEYEISFPAVIGRDNLVATQFHPEKSGPAGLRILTNFAAWDGASC